ncbi:MAG: protein jag [Aridibacter sp.]
MNEICQNVKNFLTEIIEDFGFELKASAVWSDDEGCLTNLSGEDVPLVLSENGEMLDAFETILFQLYGRELDRDHRIICDADGFRQTRKSELAMMAKFAAKNVREKEKSFTFGDLNSTERRMIHLSLQNEKDLITESVGEGSNRRLQVRLK